MLSDVQRPLGSLLGVLQLSARIYWRTLRQAGPSGRSRWGHWRRWSAWIRPSGRTRGPPEWDASDPARSFPGFLCDRLELSVEQEKQIKGLQKEVDSKLSKILNDEQNQQLKEMGERGPGVFGPPGGPGGGRGVSAPSAGPA